MDTPRLGLKKMGMSARGLLVAEDEDYEGQSVASEADVVLVGRAEPEIKKGKGKNTSKRRGRESLSREDT